MSKVSDFNDVADRVLTTQRLQANHEKGRAGATSGWTGANLKKP